MRPILFESDIRGQLDIKAFTFLDLRTFLILTFSTFPTTELFTYFEQLPPTLPPKKQV